MNAHFPTPLPGRIDLPSRYRWLTPPATFRRASGSTRTFAVQFPAVFAVFAVVKHLPGSMMEMRTSPATGLRFPIYLFFMASWLSA
jgi:hypothetical protein